MPTSFAQQGLTIYLIKQGKSLRDIIPNAHRFQHQSFQSGDHTFELYSMRAPSKLPKWAKFFPSTIDTSKLGKTSSAGAILLVVVDSRQYALTFGTGRFYLDGFACEDRFGLRIVLNTVKNVRSIDKDSFDSIGGKTRTQAAKGSPIGMFGIDVERDLLKAVTGIPSDKTLGNRVSGIDGLSVLISLKFDDLPDYIRKLYIQSISDAYKKTDFSFVDQIRAVSNKPVIDALDALLVAKLTAKRVNTDEIEMILPEIVDFANVGYFTYKNTPSKPEYLHDIGLKTFLTTVEDSKWILSLDTLKTRKVYSVNSNDEIRPVGKVYTCLWAEVIYSGKKYLLSAGKWYVIDKGFLEKVNSFFDSAQRYPPAILPVFKHDKGEGQYNEFVRKTVAGFHLFDKKLLHPEKKQSFEFCDLYSEAHGAKDIVHVKVGKSSSALSHLFNQGTVSAETFLEFPECRAELNKKLLPPALRIPDPTAKPNTSDYRIVFAIIRAKGSKLPFFARVNLRQTFRMLDKWNYRPVLAEVPIDPTWFVTKNVTKKAKKRKSI